MERRTFLKSLGAMLGAIVAAPAALLRRERTAVPWRWYMENTTWPTAVPWRWYMENTTWPTAVPWRWYMETPITWTSEEITLNAAPCDEEKPYSVFVFRNEYGEPLESRGFNPEDRTSESKRN